MPHKNSFAYLLLLTLMLLSGGLSAQKLHRYEYSKGAMGTIFRIVLYAQTEEVANKAAHDAFARIEDLNMIMSDYDLNSELSRLSATSGQNQQVVLSPDLYYIIAKSQKIARKTEGAFDITVGPVVQLWRRARRRQELPDSAAIQQALATTGYRHILLNKRKRSARLLIPGMKLDLGAIGKGYAVDEAMKVIRKYGIQSALVDGGGNIAISKAPPGTKGWKIEVLPPGLAEDDESLYLLLKNCAMASSGDIYQYLEIDGIRYSHIVDPLTGLGLKDQKQVTIITRNATDADWLSTAVSVLPESKGLLLAEQTPRTVALLLRKNGENEKPAIYFSRRFKNLKANIQ